MADTLKTIRSRFEIIANELSDDSTLTPKMIEDTIVTIRNTLVTRDYIAHRKVSREFYQTFNKLVIQSKEVTINGLTNNINELFVEIPTLLSGIDTYDCIYFGDVARTLPFKRCNLDEYIDNYGGMYSPDKTPIYTIVEDGIYMKNVPNRLSKYFGAIVVLQDPREHPDWSEDNDFPIAGYLINRLEYVLEQKLLKKSGIPYDTMDDATDNRPLMKQPTQNQEE